MIRKAFKMRIFPEMAEEYKRRHAALWSEMKEAIHEHGGHNYSIFLDSETCVLYGYIEIEDMERWAELASNPINREWWEFMSDIMETNPDNSPVSIDLAAVFHLD